MKTRHLLAAAAALALVAGCGGDDAPTVTADDDRAAASATATPSPAEPGASPAATQGGAVMSPASPTAAAGASQPPAVQEPAETQSQAAGSQDTAPGTYTYDASGTVTAGTPRQVDGTATLTVDPPAGGMQHSVLAGEQGRTEQEVVTRSSGRYLARLAISNPAFAKEFRPAQPVLLIPTPPSVGRSWSWTAKSTDGKTTASVTARITRTETLTIGGVRTPTTVVESTLRLTGDVTYTGQMQTWYDAAHRLTVKDHTKGEGTVNGFAFTTDITSVLRSTKPA